MIRRTDAMQKEHTSMFNFKLAITDNEIVKLKDITTEEELLQCRAYLLKELCREPAARHDRQIYLLESFSPTAKGNRPVQLASTSYQSTGSGSAKQRSRALRKRPNHKRQRRS